MQHLHMSQLPRVDPAGRCGPEQQHSNDHRLTPTWRHLTGNKHLSKQLRSHLVLQNMSWFTFVQHHLTQDREEAPSQKMCNCCNKYSTYPKKSTLLVCNPWPWVAPREELGGAECGYPAPSFISGRKAHPKLLLLLSLCSTSSEHWQFQVCCPYLLQDLPAKRWHTCLVMTNCLITSLAICNTLYLLLSLKLKKMKKTSITLRKKSTLTINFW